MANDPKPPLTSKDTNADAEGLKEAVNDLIRKAQQGNADAWEQVYSLLYDDLHRIANSEVRRYKQGAMHSPTSLVNEAWIRLSGAHVALNDRTHLISLIARAMRYVMLNKAEHTLAKKRGGDAEFVELDNSNEPHQRDHIEQLLALDRALNDLSNVDDRLARVTEMRYFAGLSEEEIAAALQISVRSVRRDWRTAKAFLLTAMEGGIEAL